MITEKTTYEVGKDDLKAAIDETISDLISEKVLAPYQFREVGTMGACEILNISQPTLYRWVEAGKLIPVWRGNGSRNYRFNLRYLLQFNIGEIKGKKIHTLKSA